MNFGVNGKATIRSEVDRAWLQRARGTSRDGNVIGIGHDALLLRIPNQKGSCDTAENAKAPQSGLALDTNQWTCSGKIRLGVRGQSDDVVEVHAV